MIAQLVSWCLGILCGDRVTVFAQSTNRNIIPSVAMLWARWWFSFSERSAKLAKMILLEASCAAGDMSWSFPGVGSCVGLCRSGRVAESGRRVDRFQNFCRIYSVKAKTMLVHWINSLVPHSSYIVNLDESSLALCEAARFFFRNTENAYKEGAVAVKPSFIDCDLVELRP